MTRFLGLLIALLALPVQADIYKCRLANGRTEISNAPCPAGSGTLTTRPDDTVSEQSRQQAERDVERMRSFVEKREATQRTEEAAERQRQSSARQSAAQQRVYQSASMSECLRELELNPVEPSRQAELEAICRAKARSEPTLVPVPVYGSPHVMPYPRPHHHPEPKPKPKPGKPCPRDDKFCVR
ncbi:MAG: DUF4124 domain-containing protein [Dechloromonas sp.]|nr:DUF4124 domain-containing protein [Dechloromonas sp.]